MNDHTDHVKKKIESNNQWYTSSQFAWAEKESVRRIYDQRFLFFYKIIKRETDRKGKISLLDYGCGDGYWSLTFSRFSDCEVTGVDYNPLRLERAKVNVKNARFIEMDLSNPNDNLGKFNIIFCSQIMEHIKDDILFLKGIGNYLEKDGIVILGTPNEGSFTHRHVFRKRILKRSDHVHFYREGEIRNKIVTAGFVIKDIYREVFFSGHDRLYYKLTSTDFGFKLLELSTILFPSQCSDYYFELKLK